MARTSNHTEYGSLSWGEGRPKIYVDVEKYEFGTSSNAMLVMCPNRVPNFTWPHRHQAEQLWKQGSAVLGAS